MKTEPAPARVRRRDWRLVLGVPVGWAVIRLLAMTWRVSIRGDAGLAAIRGGAGGVVLALWHGQLLPLSYAFRGRGILVLVSEHRDGEVIARLLARMGYGTIRGSTTRGGARALAGMIRALRGGATVGITPDGPRGPARRFAPGALVAAQRADVPIVTLFATVSRAWTLRSWDSFAIPKPFARVVVHVGPPTRVAGGTPSEAVAEAERFEAMIAPVDATHA